MQNFKILNLNSIIKYHIKFSVQIETTKQAHLICNTKAPKPKNTTVEHISALFVTQLYQYKDHISCICYSISSRDGCLSKMGDAYWRYTDPRQQQQLAPVPSRQQQQQQQLAPIPPPLAAKRPRSDYGTQTNLSSLLIPTQSPCRCSHC